MQYMYGLWRVDAKNKETFDTMYISAENEIFTAKLSMLSKKDEEGAATGNIPAITFITDYDWDRAAEAAAENLERQTVLNWCGLTDASPEVAKLDKELEVLKKQRKYTDEQKENKLKGYLITSHAIGRKILCEKIKGEEAERFLEQIKENL